MTVAETYRWSLLKMHVTFDLCEAALTAYGASLEQWVNKYS